MLKVCRISWDLRAFWSCVLNNFDSLRVSKIRFDLRLTLVKMRSFIFNVFLNPARVPKSCNLNIFFSHFFFIFPSFNYVYRNAARVLNSWIYSWDAGRVFFGILKQIYQVYKYNFLHKVFYNQIVFSHSYLMICVRTAADAWSNIKMRDIILSQKLFVLAETLLSL